MKFSGTRFLAAMLVLLGLAGCWESKVYTIGQNNFSLLPIETFDTVLDSGQAYSAHVRYEGMGMYAITLPSRQKAERNDKSKVETVHLSFLEIGNGPNGEIYYLAQLADFGGEYPFDYYVARLHDGVRPATGFHAKKA